MKAEDVIHFWFKELSREEWFKKDPAIDRTVKNKFEKTLLQASRGELFFWRKTSLGRLAEIIVLDQFSRNIYRNDARAFSHDVMALTLAQEMVAQKLDQDLPPYMRSFVYMPYMHSESHVIHQEAIKLFSGPKLEFNLKFEREHKKIIDLFGRYPHRNKILKRKSTPEEKIFIKGHPGF